MQSGIILMLAVWLIAAAITIVRLEYSARGERLRHRDDLRTYKQALAIERQWTANYARQITELNRRLSIARPVPTTIATSNEQLNKLLALALQPGTEQEGYAALRRAQVLAKKHNIRIN